MIDRDSIQLVLLPPIASDGRAYYRMRGLPYEVITPEHIYWRDHESLKEHAIRYYAHLVTSGEVDPNKPIIWSGLSLGGALAQEFSLLHPPIAQILIATFTSNMELSPIVRGLGKTSHRIPIVAYNVAGVVAPLIMKAIGYMNSADIDMMIAGYRPMSKRSIRNAFKALSEWRGVDRASNIPTLRIHGKHDPLIPMSRIGGVDVVLDTLHLVTLSKPNEVNQSVIEFVSRL